MDYFFSPAPPEHIRREKAKARELRLSQWWKNQIGKGICAYCDGRFPVAELTMDHRIPIVRGGTSTRSNVVVSCKACNTEKKYLTPVELTIQREKLGRTEG